MRSDSTCVAESCDRPVHSRGWCASHYASWWRHGDPMIARCRLVRGTVEERFDFFVVVTPGCWGWTGETTRQGYGRMSVKADGRFPQRGSAPAHVVSYMLHVGPIPDGLVLDHLCMVKSCTNWMHLEPVTHQENIQRYWRTVPPRERCHRGHDLTVPNAFYYAKTTGKGQCRLCVRENQNARAHLKRSSGA